jgi:hypothetical protein
MAKYLLIETRDPFESGDVAFYHDLARRLAAEGNQVTLYLVRTASPGTPGARAAGLDELVRPGLKCSPTISLRERGTPRPTPGGHQTIPAGCGHRRAG